MPDLLHNPRFWVAVAIVVFILLAARKLWGALTSVLDKRAETIKAELEEAASLRTEAEKMLADASAKRESALQEAAALLNSAREEARRLGEEAHAEAQEAAKRREKMALDRIEAAEKAAIADVRNQAAAIAARAAETVIREGLTQERAAGLVQEGIEALPRALKAQA